MNSFCVKGSVSSGVRRGSQRTHESTSDRRKLGVEKGKLEIVNLSGEDLLAERSGESAGDGMEEDGVVVRGDGERIGERDCV